MKGKTKDGKNLKMEEQIEQEDPDCEPPAAKKKKKKDKMTADQENGHKDEATDMNGNSNIETSPKKKKTKKNNEANTKVCLFFLCIFKHHLRPMPCWLSPFHTPCLISPLLFLL